MIGIIIFIIGFGAVLIFPFVTIQFLYETYENFLKMTKDLKFSLLSAHAWADFLFTIFAISNASSKPRFK